MINLRQEFLNLLKEDGWNVYLQRRSSDDEWGFSNILEKHLIRNRFASSASATRRAQEQDEGVSVSADNVFYFRWDVNPGEGDRIYEQFPNQATGQVVWLIDYSQPFRGTGGAIIYWVAGCTREDTSKNSTVRPEIVRPDIPRRIWDGGNVDEPYDDAVDGGTP